MYDKLLVRYGEISLKGRNRSRFEHVLLRQIRTALGLKTGHPIQKVFGRLYIDLDGRPWEPTAQKLADIFGIVSISPVKTCAEDLEALKTTAALLGSQIPGRSFKIQTRRINKSFPLRTPEINRILGQHVLDEVPSLRVDVHQPDFTIFVELRPEATFLHGLRLPGLGGLPVGTSGRGLLLLSGGIDSPVAGFLSMKRGVTLEVLHFHSFPFTSRQAQEKTAELARHLAAYNSRGKIRFWLCDFSEIQRELQNNPYPDLKITLMRRFMLRIAAELARDRGILALITGDSLGQVASQTMHSLHTINAVTTMPVLRPLVGMDKQEIIDISRRIGTYETSILPYDDCCTVFVPKTPATRPKPADAELAESYLDGDSLVKRALDSTQYTWVAPAQTSGF